MLKPTAIRSLWFAFLVLSAPTAAAAQAEAWTIDPGHSAAQFSVRHMVVSNVKGEFDGPAGTVTFDPKDASTLRVEASIDAKTIDTRNPDRDADLRGTLFFDVEKFPRITFTSRRASADGPGRIKVVGDLTMHGVTKEVTLDVQGSSQPLNDPFGNVKLGGVATTHLNRQDFGIAWSKALDGGGLVVGDDVDVTIDLEVTKK